MLEELTFPGFPFILIEEVRSLFYIHYIVNSMKINNYNNQSWVRNEDQEPLKIKIIGITVNDICVTKCAKNNIYLVTSLLNWNRITISSCWPLKPGFKPQFKYPTGGNLIAFTPRVDEVWYKMYLEQESRQKYKNFGW